MTPHAALVDVPARIRRVLRSAFVALYVAAWVLAAPAAANASLMSPEVEDKVATYIAVFALFFVPVVLIVLFWVVHVMPEKIAHKNHHPQFEAIRTLCLLSLVFGGLLWPIAWLWAYTKPVMHKMAYGTDKHPDYFKEHGLPAPESPADDIRKRLTALEVSADPSVELEAIRSDLDALERRMAAAARSGVS